MTQTFSNLLQDAVFYVSSASYEKEVAWAEDKDEQYFIARNGRMFGRAVDKQGKIKEIHCTGHLTELGILCDKDLDNWQNFVRDLEWFNTPWFEVLYYLEDEYESDVYHTIDDAIEAIEEEKQNG